MESVGSITMYAIVAIAMIVFSMLAVTTRKILRAATYLLFSLFAVAAAYFMLDYEFLGGVQIAVYAGGIVVLFVFSILLTGKPGDNSEPLVTRSKLMGLTAAFATLAVCGWALIDRVANFVKLPAQQEGLDMHKIGETMLGTGHGQYLLPFEAVSVLLLACIIGGIVVARKR